MGWNDEPEQKPEQRPDWGERLIALRVWASSTTTRTAAEMSHVRELLALVREAEKKKAFEAEMDRLQKIVGALPACGACGRKISDPFCRDCASEMDPEGLVSLEIKSEDFVDREKPCGRSGPRGESGPGDPTLIYGPPPQVPVAKLMALWKELGDAGIVHWGHLAGCAAIMPMHATHCTCGLERTQRALNDLGDYQQEVVMKGHSPSGSLGLSKQGAQALMDAHQKFWKSEGSARWRQGKAGPGQVALMDTFLWYSQELAQTARWGRESDNAMEVVGDGDGTRRDHGG